MRTIYGGIDLMPLKTHEFNMEAVYDDSGVDYLFTRVTLIVESLVNGQVEVVSGVRGANGPPISYALDGGNTTTVSLGTSGSSGSSGALPAAAPQSVRAAPTFTGAPFSLPSAGVDIGGLTSAVRGIVRVPNAPPLTHISIRHRLSTPRGKLYIFSGPGMESPGGPAAGTSGPPLLGTICVESPEPFLITDCKNGPFPKVLSVTEAAGDATTFVVTFAVETFINEAALNGVNPRGPMVSNRFSQEHHVDEDGYTTVRTTGISIFRTDLVYASPQSPDYYRAILFAPIPQGFTRVVDSVKGREDVSGIEYVYTDTQVKSNFVAGPYTRASSISAVHRQAVTSNADVLGGALSAYERILGIAANKNIGKSEKDDKDADKKAMRKLARMIGRSVAKSVKAAPVPKPAP